jgi:hypothetical protein
MKRILTNTIAALAVVAGLVIGAVGHGLLVCLVALALMYAGALTLISKNTDWLWHA